MWGANLRQAKTRLACLTERLCFVWATIRENGHGEFSLRVRGHLGTRRLPFGASFGMGSGRVGGDFRTFVPLALPRG